MTTVPPMAFIKGETYSRAAILEAFGGQGQGGIITPSAWPLVFLITSEEGKQHGYRDHWTPDGIFRYSGEGRFGDQVMQRGNKAIRDHEENGEDLFLFEKAGDGYVRFVSQMVYLTHDYVDGVDEEGNPRRQFLFDLAPVASTTPVEGYFPPATPPTKGKRKPEDTPQPPPVPKEPAAQEEALWTKSMADLRQLALTKAQPTATAKERKVTMHERSEAVRVYVLRRADGICEGCQQPAPFKNKQGKPYLEPHHTRRLSDGGPDHPKFMVAVCPNCHRRAHYGEDGPSYNAHLTQVAKQKES